MLRYESLKHLPPYGPMHISISDEGEGYASEGFIMRFYKEDSTNWVANFKPGLGKIYKVLALPKHNKIIIVAGGTGYLMSPENTQPLACFGGITEVYQATNGNIACCNPWYVFCFNNESGEFSRSEKITFDGIKDLHIDGSIVIGKGYEVRAREDVWIDFSYDMVTGKISGGAWQSFIEDNPDYKSPFSAEEVKIAKGSKPWWQFWA